MVTRRTRRAGLASLALLAGCSGNVPISVSVTPSVIDLSPGEHQTFHALVEGSFDNSVTWSLVSGPGGIGPGGDYTAPPTVGLARIAIVRATSVTNPTKYSDSIVTIAPVLSFAAGPALRFDPSHGAFAGLAFTDGKVVAAFANDSQGSASRTAFSGSAEDDVFNVFAPVRPVAIDRALLNGDGTDDAVLVETEAACCNGAVWIARGGSSSPETWDRVYSGTAADASHVDDIDRDGFADIIAMGGKPGSDSAILFGPDFTTRTHPFSTGGVVFTVASTADFDQDGFVDLVVLDPGGSIVVIPGSGGASFFDFSHATTLPVAHPVSMAVGDFDSDHLPDVLCAVTSTAGSAVQTFSNRRDLHFASPVTVPVAGSIVDMASADFEGDGRPDLAIATTSSVVVLRGLLGGDFEQHSFPISAVPSHIAIGDGTGDGLLDAAVAVTSNGAPVVFTLRNTSH